MSRDGLGYPSIKHDGINTTQMVYLGQISKNNNNNNNNNNNGSTPEEAHDWANVHVTGTGGPGEADVVIDGGVTTFTQIPLVVRKLRFAGTGWGRSFGRSFGNLNIPEKYGGQGVDLAA
ncbi:MAG: hypothetical protein WA118_06310 [Carboxydocellales bacterium]